MDKNSITGLLIIGAILVGFFFINKPSEEEIERQKTVRDSIVQVQNQKALEEAKRFETQETELKEQITSEAIQAGALTLDSIDSAKLKNMYGSFADAAQGENEFITLENELIKIKLATKGGRAYSVQLKEFQTYDTLPLRLFNGDSTIFGLNFFAENRSIVTNNMFFTPVSEDKVVIVEGTDEKSVALRLYAEADKYIEYLYTLAPNSYQLDFDINIVGMDDIISQNTNYLDLKWEIFVPQQEKGAENENNYSTIYYKYYEDEVDYLSERSDDDEELATKVKWIAFKQQFFSSVLIADDYLLNGKVKQIKFKEGEYLAHYSADISLPYDSRFSQTIPLKFYFGPNHYYTLKEQNKEWELHKMVPLGWGIFGYVNRIAVIPVFNWLDNHIGNYGLIILILTILLKLVLFPLTFKSYISTAKMRVLKPQIDELSKKFSKDKAMEKQQATMALYKKAGVNPMGGCLPMLVQMPILIAMFRFFPTSFELRQKGFLWAEDLSAYDSILDLPFEIPFYGDHVSLFCLLMTVTTILYTKMNNQMTASNAQMPGMKTMMYMMPVMFLFFFNNYASGLSYYYFLANLITFGQMALIKLFIDDKAILKKLEESKKKPVKKSKFQQRLEDVAKKKGYNASKK